MGTRTDGAQALANVMDKGKGKLAKFAERLGGLPLLGQCDRRSLVTDPTDAAHNHLRSHEQLLADLIALQVRHC